MVTKINIWQGGDPSSRPDFSKLQLVLTHAQLSTLMKTYSGVLKHALFPHVSILKTGMVTKINIWQGRDPGSRPDFSKLQLVLTHAQLFTLKIGRAHV